MRCGLRRRRRDLRPERIGGLADDGAVQGAQVDGHNARALADKSQLAATKSQLDATTAAANGAAEGVKWYDACLVYYDLDQYEGYAYERPGGFATTTTFDFAGQGRDGLIGDEIGRARPYHFTAFDAFNDACVIDSGEGWAGEPLAAHHRGGRAVVRSK